MFLRADGTAVNSSAAADLETFQRLAAILSPAHATARCARKLTFGGNCECNYREPASGRDQDIQFDMHLYGQRRVCIDPGYLSPGGSCFVLAVQSGRYNGAPSKLWDQLVEFGCAKSGMKYLFTEKVSAARRFSLRREARPLGGGRLDLLDVSVPGLDRDVLWDLLQPRAKVTARQVALTVVLDQNEVTGDEEGYAFTADVARGHLKLLTQLEAAGYRMLSFKPHPKCVEAVSKAHNICLPILSNTVWIK